MAIEVALRIGAEVISVDSMQVYRGMNVGTAKPTHVERRGVTHHMIDVADPEDEFSAAEFRRMARAIVSESERPLIIAGGSGLHFRALVDPMTFAPTDTQLRERLEERPLEELVAELGAADVDAGRHVDLANRRRVVRAVEIYRLTGETPSGRHASAEAGKLRDYVPELEFKAVGIDPGQEIEGRIARRLADMRMGGLVEEVAGLRNRLGRTARTAVGYAEMLDYLDGAMTLDEAFAATEQSTRRLARRQRTWFQRDPRIRWLPWLGDPTAHAERVMETIG